MAEADGRLQRGDVIVAVDGTRFGGLSHAEAIAVLKVPRLHACVTDRLRGVRYASRLCLASAKQKSGITYDHALS